MGVIATVLEGTTTVLAGFPKIIFDGVGPGLAVALKAAGALALIGIAVNQVLQIRQVSFMEYIIWLVRFGCILAFATIWTNFQPFYNLIVKLPQEYSSVLIQEVKETKRVWKEKDEAACGLKSNKGPFGWIVWSTEPASCWVDEETTKTPAKDANGSYKTGTYDLLDTFAERIFGIGTDILKEFSFFDGSTWKNIIIAFIVYIIGIIFTVVAIITALTAELGVAVSMGLAPLAIAMLTFNQTRHFFESWLKLTVGFAIVPLLIISIMSLIVTAASNVQKGDDFFGGFLPLILITVAGLTFMKQVPNLAGSLANVSLPKMGNAAVLSSLSSMYQAARSPFALADAVGNRAGAGMNQWQVSKAKGRGDVLAAFKGLAAMSQSAQFRAEKHNRHAYQKRDLEYAKSRFKKKHQGSESGDGEKDDRDLHLQRYLEYVQRDIEYAKSYKK